MYVYNPLIYLVPFNQFFFFLKFCFFFLSILILQGAQDLVRVFVKSQLDVLSFLIKLLVSISY